MKMDFLLRRARPEDQRQIRHMVRRARLNPFGLHWQRFWVAETEADGIIGVGQIRLHRDGSAELASLVVEEEWRQRGVARALIHTLHGQVGPPLWLMCAPRLVPFYQRFGYVEPGSAVLPRHFRRIARVGRCLNRLLPHGVPAILVAGKPDSE